MCVWLRILKWAIILSKLSITLCAALSFRWNGVLKKNVSSPLGKNAADFMHLRQIPLMLIPQQTWTKVQQAIQLKLVWPVPGIGLLNMYFSQLSAQALCHQDALLRMEHYYRLQICMTCTKCLRDASHCYRETLQLQTECWFCQLVCVNPSRMYVSLSC